ncbi:hypothetical protein GSB9_00594 [Flavobacteriaceae bacterium GSB9]|nr:hypothetical protein GSB9_00594 [Flavobacteriaceae bacterium GSB9]
MKYLVSLILCLLALQINAQDPYLQNDHEALEDIAKKITMRYNKELALNGKQPLLFQKKVEEFLIREKNIRKRFSGEVMLDLIYKLRVTETGEMANILTRQQLNLYKRIKPSIQPLQVVKAKSKTDKTEKK